MTEANVKHSVFVTAKQIMNSWHSHKSKILSFFELCCIGRHLLPGPVAYCSTECFVSRESGYKKWFKCKTWLNLSVGVAGQASPPTQYPLSWSWVFNSLEKNYTLFLCFPLLSLSLSVSFFISLSFPNIPSPYIPALPSSPPTWQSQHCITASV